MNFVDCESFLESNTPDILTLYETNLDDSIHSGNFSVSGYLCLIQKDSTTHMDGLAVYVKEGLPFVQDLSILVELIDLVNSNFSISNNLTQVVNFATQILFWICLFLLMLVFVLQ